MKKIKRIITSILLSALTLSVFAFTGCKTSQEETSNDNVDVGLAVLASYEETTATDEECFVKELIATVSGDNVTNVELEWSIAWEQTNDEDINNYLVLEPSAFNEESKTSTCKIKLLAPLPYTAIVYVNCKNNDLTAKCFVNYSPSTHSISVDVSSLKVTQDSYYNVDINVLTKGTNYSFDISSLGLFGEELSAEDIEIEFTAVGKFKMNSKYGNTDVLFDKDLTSFINPMVEKDGITTETAYTPYLKYSIDNNKLIINAVNSVYDLEYQVKVENSLNYFSYFSLVEENEPYVTLTLKNTANNVSVSYNFRVYPKLSIVLNQNSIIFS